ncbi:hypothetical protein DFO70_10377 [Cytobacillus firmus]|uniref:Uncharacterized protein n=2 Tax=Cytobacillus TaxID=2675230 RepID=A0A366K1C5_CYTFI|nr:MULTISPECIES: hypothetical protein [Cytobacillus]RBP95047.1 hypothetical protein DFO70_10377 [Cytobacillus firmus]TDX43888.1 hypothetical protein DFO72_10490 [Cytobacillus oceanisediminis]
MMPSVTCPRCMAEKNIDAVLTAQSNQNVIFRCPDCGYEVKDIQTSKG